MIVSLTYCMYTFLSISLLLIFQPTNDISCLVLWMFKWLWQNLFYFGVHISIIASSVFLHHGLMAEFAHLHHCHIRIKKVSMFSSHCYSPTVPCHIHHHSPTGQAHVTNGSWHYSWNPMSIFIALVLIPMILSCRNFAHFMSAWLLWLVRNCDMVRSFLYVKTICIFKRFWLLADKTFRKWVPSCQWNWRHSPESEGHKVKWTDR